MTPTVYRYTRDKWAVIPITEVVEGDLIIANGKALELSHRPFLNDSGQWTIPSLAKDLHNARQSVEPSSTGYDYIDLAIDLTYGVLHKFADRTAVIIPPYDKGLPYVYSPRMKKKDLDIFCKKHMEQYAKHGEKGGFHLGMSDPIEMEPFWSKWA